MDRDKIYYVKKGKFESNAQVLTSLMPKVGFCDNPYINCFTVMSGIYHDAYCNGWGGNTELYEKRLKTYVRPIMGARFGNMKRFYSDPVYLEECIDKVLSILIKAKDFKFTRLASVNTSKRKVYFSDVHFNGYPPKSFTSYSEIEELARVYRFDIEHI